MICRGTSAVEAICLAVVIAEKVHARNFVYALRFLFALRIQLPQHASCYKMNSIYRQPNVIIASLDSCSAYSS